ncbi:MAG: DUF4965 domain-containing protein [Verrucomicrobiales bacterium]|nr:DUF4965 domain-containing protein [Verrucomicrobiales bacterium]
MKFPPNALLLACAVVVASSLNALAAWAPARGPLMTRWAKDVAPERALPEYPRPQLARSDWLNLNGLWDYAIVPAATERPAQWDGQILVPFPVESALSGVMKTVGQPNRLWYRRTFEVPASWAGRKVQLHFGAVDWRAEVWVNGQRCGEHTGGYDGFSFDISGNLKPGAPQELIVAVWDPSDAGTQPRGKQVARPEGIWYTPTTGIWQTVWLEPVAPSHIEDLTLKSKIESGELQVSLKLQTAGEVQCRVAVLQGETVVVEASEVTRGSQAALTLKVPNPRLWSPDDPFLYDLRLTLSEGGRVVDEVRSYAGLRKIEVAKDVQGIQRLFLNGKALFQFGPLDQGFWPDGLYTAPTDEALRYDIEMTKQLGFNMARKHVKVEPDRWYYWCDKLGLLVWQDMPSGDRYIGTRDPDITRTPESGAQFEKELRRLIDGRFNHPSIVMWVPYNEGWGQWDTARIVELVRSWDPTRLVNNTSGWTDRGVGDVNDIHVYPGPGAPDLEAKRAGVLGEFGGLGLPVKGHTWQDEKNWGYRSFTSSEDLTDAYLGLIRRLHPLTGRQGLSAAVYTQTTDVEVEVNGLMTYDRAQVKMDAALVAAANRSVYNPPADRVSVSTNLVPPATPLVACDPYFSIWSPADRLTDEDTVHWTGRPHRLSSLLRVDGKGYRVLGPSPASLPALEQKSLEVLPTRTVVRFEGAGIAVTLTFMTPAIPEDIDLLSRPVTYVTCEAKSTDGKPHEIQWYLDASGELTVNNGNQEVVRLAPTGDFGDLEVVSAGSKQQPVLAKKGDDLRIDWGYLYLAAPRGVGAGKGYGDRSPLLRAFVSDGRLPADAAVDGAVRRGDQVTLATTVSLGSVGDKKVSRWMLLAYDDLYSIQYMKKNLRPYWRRSGWEAADLLKASAAEYDKLTKRCRELDEELMKDLRKVGGEKYARIAALAYRHCFAAGKFVADANGQPLQFCKENHSNGCIGTSDVFYPMAPQFLLLGPTLAKSFLVPFMNYAASERWTFPFAPHDIGTYPQANGQVYGGGERTEENQMPVEETGNLMILMAAVAQMEGHAGFAGLYWQRLEKWADYLKAKGFDPENQLCTDDFAGHLAHNVNLSAKAICGLGSFAKLCEMRGNKAQAQEYFTLARGFAERWVKEAADGEKYRLAFDKPGTWSQKYNLVWDRILGLNLFPASVLRTEMDFYKKNQNTYGLPLDSRETYTKLDWIVWTATLTRNRADFETLVDPIFRYLNEAPDRAPMSDWYQTKSARKVGFTARPVVGGVFLPLLYERDVWRKYAKRDRTKGIDWAPMPKAPKISVVVPTAREGGVNWRYTLERPARGWNEPGFDDSGWREGAAGFGTRGTPGAVIGTEWSTHEIHLRRTFELPAGAKTNALQLFIHHDEDAQVFLNGQLIADLGGYTSEYDTVPLSAEAVKALVSGKNSLAIRCRQTGGGQYIDAGLVTVEEVP